MEKVEKKSNEKMNEFKFEKVETIDTLCDGCCFAAGFGLTFGVALALT